MQTGRISSGVTRNSGPVQMIYPCRALPPYLRVYGPPPPFHSLLQHLTWRPTWPADQPAHLAIASQPGGPVRPVKVGMGTCPCALWSVKVAGADWLFTWPADQPAHLTRARLPSPHLPVQRNSSHLTSRTQCPR